MPRVRFPFRVFEGPARIGGILLGHMMIAPNTLEKTLEALAIQLKRVEDPARDDWDPLDLGLRVAMLEYPTLDIEMQKKAFNDVVDTALKEFPKNASKREQSSYLLTAFRDVLGFQGDTTNYYN